MKLTDDQLKTYPKKLRGTLKGLALGTERASGIFFSIRTDSRLSRFTPKAKYLKRMLNNTLRVNKK